MMLKESAKRWGKIVPDDMERSMRRERAASIIDLVATDHCAHCSQGDAIEDPNVLRAANRIIRFCDEKGATVIGVTGCEPGPEVSRLADVLATCHRQIGRRVKVIDATPLGAGPDKGRGGEESGGASCGCRIKVETPEAVESLRKAVAAKVAGDGDESGHTDLVLVILPSVLEAGGAPCEAFRSVASMCEMAFLTCLTGQVSPAVLRDCVVQCDIHNVQLGGLIMNDEKFAGGRWLADN